jgi:hypothetical protein
MAKEKPHEVFKTEQNSQLAAPWLREKKLLRKKNGVFKTEQNSQLAAP